MTSTSDSLATTAGAPRSPLPGFWKMTWMFWMQPILLHQTLRECGIDQPDGRLVRLWLDTGDNGPVCRQYVRSLGWQFAFLLFLVMPAFAFSVAGTIAACGIPVDFGGVAIGVASGVVGGMAGAVGLGVFSDFVAAMGAMVGGFTVGVALGVAVGGAVGTGGVAVGLVVGLVVGLAVGVVVGVAGGVAQGVAVGVATGVARGVAGSVASGAFIGMGVGVPVGASTGVAFGVAFGVAYGVATVVACTVTIFRVPLFPIELVVTWCAPLVARIRGGGAVRYSPVLFHDLSYLPLPGLERQILEAAHTDLSLVRTVLKACQRSPGQRKTGARVLAILKARELKDLLNRRDWQCVSELRGEWLAGDREEDGRVQAFAEAARYLRAASQAVVARHRLQQIDRAQLTLQSLRNQLLSDRSRETTEFGLTLDTAESVAQELRREAERLAADQVPNPFRAGPPLDADYGQETFRGREDLVRQIELLLGDDDQAAAVSVIAPRRCGKSSLLRMLPVKLPDALCVFFDLQDNPVTTPLDLFPALARRMVEQARPAQRESLPKLADRSLAAVRDWLDALEQRPGRDRVLLCLDEFERLEETVDQQPESKAQLVQLMGLLRATIQHRRRVRILVAGTATFEELGPLWNDTFISAHELRLGPLERDVAIDLLRQPIPESEGFPPDTIGQEIAETVVDRTGGQPYLTQLYGFWLVEELNRQKRRRAEPADVETVDDTVFEQAAPFFRDSLHPRGATFEVRPVIEQIVAGETPELTPGQRRFLIRRGLITADGTLAFPILARWLNEYAE